MFGCQQVLISNTEILPYLEFICFEANKLINCGTYYGRQIYFKTGKIISKFDLNYEYKKNCHYQFLCAQAAQQVLLSVAEAFNSFRKLVVCYKRGEVVDKPKPQQYLFLAAKAYFLLYKFANVKIYSDPAFEP